MTHIMSYQLIVKDAQVRFTLGGVVLKLFLQTPSFQFQGKFISLQSSAYDLLVLLS